MIKPTELRIGNFINCFDIETEAWCVDSVAAISREDFYTKDEVEGNAEANGSYDGILLTEEWLLNFEFENRGHYWFQKIGVVIGYITKDDVFQYEINHDMGVVDIKYVHQFQNLYFALTGQELTVKVQANA